MYSVIDLIKAYLPNGSGPLNNSRKASWSEPPAHPATVFAVAAALMHRSGGYQHLLSYPGLVSGQPGNDIAGTTLIIAPEDQKQVTEAARLWRSQQSPQLPPTAIRGWWKVLIKYSQEPIGPSASFGSEVPAWWKAAALLMTCSDSASEGLGFFDPNPRRKTPWFDIVTNSVLQPAEEDEWPVPASIADVPRTLNCVLPKSRTPNVGCTLRSLSLNLSLLPPEGVVSARWIDPIAVKSDTSPLIVLAIPFPFKIPARAFDPKPKRDMGWDSFELKQTWLPDSRSGLRDFIREIRAHVEKAEENVGCVDAVILPELALNWVYFEELVDYLMAETSVEFVISGVSSDEFGKHGNFVATAIFSEDREAGLVSVRAKHHRWKLDERQVRQYALGSSLDPMKTWWESFGISQREVEIFRFRRNSTFTTLICEDLARSDPCQELLRSIGPNIVFALLMDGPQLKPRWSARYATALADDPGCSVLTLTSLGLINRQRENGLDGPMSIALWKDDRNDVREIILRPGETAAVLSLTPRVRTQSFTMDGRKKEVVSWHLGGVSSIRI